MAPSFDNETVITSQPEPQIEQFAPAPGSLTAPTLPPVLLKSGTVRLGVWASNEPLHRSYAVWRPFAEAFAASGLWPVLVTGAIAHGDVEPFAEIPDIVAPISPVAGFDRFDISGQSTTSGTAQEPLQTAFEAMVASSDACTHLALIPTSRPADVPAAIGWHTSWSSNCDIRGEQLAAVFRSWEDRFGATLIGMTVDAFWFAVARPPASHEEALGVAAEHVAVCGDLTDDDGTAEERAREILGSASWRFHWR